MRLGAVVLVALVAVPACKKKPDEGALAARAQAAAAPYRARLEKQAAALAAVREAARSHQGRVEPLRREKEKEAPSLDSGSAVLLFAKDQHLVAAADETGLSDLVRAVLDPPKGLSPWSSRTPEEIDAAVDAACRAALGHEYAVVLRVLDEKAARVTGYETYEGGQIYADALVYDLESRKLLGGYPVNAGTQAQLRMKAGARDYEIESRLNEGMILVLMKEAQLGLREALRRQ